MERFMTGLLRGAKAIPIAHYLYSVYVHFFTSALLVVLHQAVEAHLDLSESESVFPLHWYIFLQTWEFFPSGTSCSEEGCVSPHVCLKPFPLYRAPTLFMSLLKGPSPFASFNWNVGFSSTGNSVLFSPAQLIKAASQGVCALIKEKDFHTFWKHYLFPLWIKSEFLLNPLLICRRPLHWGFCAELSKLN